MLRLERDFESKQKSRYDAFSTASFKSSWIAIGGHEPSVNEFALKVDEKVIGFLKSLVGIVTTKISSPKVGKGEADGSSIIYVVARGQK